MPSEGDPSMLKGGVQGGTGSGATWCNFLSTNRIKVTAYKYVSVCIRIAKCVEVHRDSLRSELGCRHLPEFPPPSASRRLKFARINGRYPIRTSSDRCHIRTSFEPAMTLTVHDLHREVFPNNAPLLRSDAKHEITRMCAS